MIAAGAVAMICACGDDSASNNPANPIADNACTKAVVTADAWLLNNWVIYTDGNVTDLAGTAVGYYARQMQLSTRIRVQSKSLARRLWQATRVTRRTRPLARAPIRATRQILHRVRAPIRATRRIRLLAQAARIRPIRLPAPAPNLLKAAVP